MAGRIEKCISTNLFGEVCDYCDGGAIYKILAESIEILTYLIGALAVIGVIIAGIMYMTSAGDVTRQTKAKRRLLEIVIGILCYGVLFAFAEFLIPGGILGSTLDSTTTSCPEEPKDKDTPTTEDPKNPQSSNDPQTNQTHGVRAFTMCNTTYNIVKIQVDGVKDDGTDSTGIKKFIKDKIQKYNIDQSDKKVYNLNGSYINSSAQDGHCNAVSRNLAYDIYFDTITADSCSTDGKDPRLAGFTKITGDGDYKKMYDEIMAGRPVVRRVSIHIGERYLYHFAVVIGVKQNANRNNLSNDDFIFLETFGHGVLWNNIPGEYGGYKYQGGNCSHTTKQNRQIYGAEYFVPTSKTGKDRLDCQI